MKIKNLFPLAFILCLIVGSSTDLDAQRRGTKKRESKETTERSRSSRDRGVKDEVAVPLRDKLMYDIHIGQIGLSSIFTISAKGGVAYKFTERFSLGLGLKTFYYLENNRAPTPDASVFNYGPYIYPRFKISESFYVKGEYYYISWDQDLYNTGNAERLTQGIPMIGAGYVSGFGPWKFGLELMFIPRDEDRDFYYNDIFEYMFSFIYNF